MSDQNLSELSVPLAGLTEAMREGTNRIAAVCANVEQMSEAEVIALADGQPDIAAALRGFVEGGSMLLAAASVLLAQIEACRSEASARNN